MLASLDRRAVLIGATWTILLAAPAAIVTAVLADTDDGTDQSNWVFLAFLTVVAAYLLGGAQAGRRAPATPFTHGAAATLVGFVVIQAAGAVRRLVADESVSAGALVFNALLAASFGVVGGWLGARRAP